jgi:RNA polymerase sigma factor (sigma-70 family)
MQKSMYPITTWLNAAGSKAISPELTSELLVQLSKAEKDSKAYVKLVNRICEGNLKLLYQTVKRYSDKRQLRWGGDLTLDLLQAGFFGLHLAVERYDFKRGCKLSTCAVPWIRQRLGRHLTQKEQTIRVPEHMVMEIFYQRNNDGKHSGRKNSSKSTKVLAAAEAAMTHAMSLDMRYGDKGDTSLADMIEAPDTSNTYDYMQNRLRKAQEVMEKAGLEPKLTDFLMEYGRTGVILTAAQHAGINISRHSKIFKKAIERCQAVV